MPDVPPAVQAALHRLEARVRFLEAEQKGGIDLAALARKAARESAGSGGSPAAGAGPDGPPGSRPRADA